MAYLGTSPVPTEDGVRRGPMSGLALWNYNDGQAIRVTCYTNAAKARLMLNGREVGETKDYDDNTGMIIWDIPFAAGTLEVIGMDTAGNKTCGNTIRTSGRPHALKLNIEDNTIANGKDLAQIAIQVVDDKGAPVILADDEVTCIIEGPAKLLGLEAGNGQDMTNYRDNVHRVYRGVRPYGYIINISLARD